MTNFGTNKGISNNRVDTSPPQWAQPLFRQSINDLLNLYNRGEGGNIYNGKRVADLSDSTKEAIEGLRQTANQFNNTYLNSLLSDNSNSRSLQELASGKFIGNNAAFNSALSGALGSAADAINQQMSGAGRYGSAASSSVLANKLGNIASQAQAAQYNQDIANMLRANSQLNNQRNNNISNYINYLNSQENAYGHALDGSRLLDQNKQNQLDAEREKWQENDNRGWNRLGLLQQLMNSIAGRYGTRNMSGRDTGYSFNFGGLGKILGK